MSASKKPLPKNTRRAKRAALPRRGFVSNVVICGKTYQIKKNPRYSGGSFSLNTQEIEIGTSCSKERVSDILVHEILETILVELGFRFILPTSEPENGDYRFVMTHDDFEKAADALALVLRQTDNMRRLVK